MKTSGVAASHASSGSADLGEVMQLVEKDIQRVQEILNNSLQSDSPYVQELLDHTASFSGKRLRPALLILAGRACGRFREDHLLLGAVVELIHLATLLVCSCVTVLLHRLRATLAILSIENGPHRLLGH